MNRRTVKELATQVPADCVWNYKTRNGWSVIELSCSATVLKNLEYAVDMASGALCADIAACSGMGEDESIDNMWAAHVLLEQLAHLLRNANGALAARGAGAMIARDSAAVEAPPQDAASGSSPVLASSPTAAAVGHAPSCGGGAVDGGAAC
jgi:hypothetical protein